MIRIPGGTRHPQYTKGKTMSDGPPRLKWEKSRIYADSTTDCRVEAQRLAKCNRIGKGKSRVVPVR